MRIRLLTCAALVAAAPALAQGPSPAPSAEPPRFTISGQLRVRPEHRTALTAAADGDVVVLQRSRVGLGVRLAQAEALVEVQDARAWGSELSTLSNDRNVDVHQAYVRVPGLARNRLTLTLGRQELAYGDERLLGAVDWSTTGRSFDAAVLRLKWSKVTVDALAALVADRRDATPGKQVLAGAYAQIAPGEPTTVDAYGLSLTDSGAFPGERAGRGDVAVFTMGARYRRAPTTGLQLSAEAALQTGHRGPDAHRAHAVAGVVGYAFPGRLRPLLRLELDRASGDRDPQDGRSREFDNLFPTNHPFYGYADLIGWRNLRAARLGLSVVPATGHTLSLDLHHLGLAEARGAWKNAGGETLGRDPSGAAGRTIGREIDLLWRLPLRPGVAGMLGYSHFLPGGFTRAVRTTRHQRFLHGHVLLRF